MKECNISGAEPNYDGGGFYVGRQKTACVTGVTGQDGAYLTEYLLSLGYRVVGIKRRSSTDNLWRLRYLGVLNKKNLTIEEGDITDIYSLINVFKKYKPEEVYNLAAQSHVGTSFEQPQLTWNVTAQGAINVANALFMVNESARLYNAASSEMMGSHYKIVNGEKIQNEITKMDGNSPYGIAKFAAFNYMRVLREGYGRFICSGILYNHGSPLRGEAFFERKVTKYIGGLVKWLSDSKVNTRELSDNETNLIYGGETFAKLRLGDLSTFRDMGHSKDYVRLQHKMLQQDKPDDYIICTGETFQMKDIVKFAFECIGLDWERFVYIDKSLIRPREVEYLRGDCSKAKKELGWKPTHNLKSMIEEMVKQDIEWAKEGKSYG